MYVPRISFRFLAGMIATIFVVALLFSIAYWAGWLTPEDLSTTFTDEYSLVFEDYDGNEVRLSHFRNQVIIAHTWASWCVYCAEEIKNLALLKKEFGDDIEVVAVNRAEPIVVAKDFTDQLGLIDGVRLLHDPDDSFFKSIGGYAMPETIFIKRYGDIYTQHRGPLSLEEARQILVDVLAQ